MVKENKTLKLSDKPDKKDKFFLKEFFNYKTFMWGALLVLSIAIISFLILYIRERNIQNKKLIEDFSTNNSEEEKQEINVISANLKSAINLINAQKYGEAITVLDSEIAKKPTFNLYFNKGIALLNSGKYEECINVNDEAIKIEPNNVYGYLNKSICLTSLFKYTEAVSVLDYALIISPDNKLLKEKRDDIFSLIK